MKTVFWEVYDYELDMFTQTLKIGQSLEYQTFSWAIKNALVESMLLHLRILVDILLSRGSGNDDLNLSDELPNFEPVMVEQLKTAYGNRATVDCPCWVLNKRLAHPTKIRAGGGYNYIQTVKDLLLVVMPLVDKIAAARQVAPQQ